jgi:hypothetical protein
VTPKPPPIFIHDVENIQPLKEFLDNHVKDEYYLKQIGETLVKLQLHKAEKYVQIIAGLKEKKAEFHSNQMKSEKTFKVVIKGLHPTTDKKEISEEIKELGYEVVARIENLISRKDKRTLPVFSNNIITLLILIIMLCPPKLKIDPLNRHAALRRWACRSNTYY